MHFGKLLRRHLERTLPQWRDKYLSYKLLKKLLKGENIPSPWFHERFVDLLFEELEKFNDFYVETEEDLIIRSQVLKEKIDPVKDKGNNGIFSSNNEFIEKKMEIHKQLVSIHGEMVLLKSYSRLNFAGLIKILKKYDKRTGLSLTPPFAQLAFNQPFFITEPISQLVRECEANLELLFPLEPEVVESDQDNTSEKHSGVPEPSYDATTMSLGDKNAEIYWSTVAAVNAMQNLKEASSSYNPLSMSYIFGNKDNDSMGCVTAENSPSNSDNDDE